MTQMELNFRTNQAQVNWAVVEQFANEVKRMQKLHAMLDEQDGIYAYLTRHIDCVDIRTFLWLCQKYGLKKRISTNELGQVSMQFEYRLRTETKSSQIHESCICVYSEILSMTVKEIATLSDCEDLT